MGVKQKQVGVKQKQVGVQQKQVGVQQKRVGVQQKRVVVQQKQVVVKQKQVMAHTKHPKIQYNKAYQNKEHARRCSHVKMAITHHSISDKEMFLSILASGVSILAAVLSIVIAL